MKLRVYTTEAGKDHVPPAEHPESPERLKAIERALSRFETLDRVNARAATRDEVGRVHSSRHVDFVYSKSPFTDLASLDADTWMSPGSLEAALQACGGAIQAVDDVMAGEIEAGFVAARPPGHHAEPDRSMGFCLFNQIAVAAAHAIQAHDCTSVAIVDFDVHHGNGTQAYAESEGRVFFASIHQDWLYPGTGSADDSSDRILNLTVERGAGSSTWREALEEHIFPRLAEAPPDILFVSAGFDGHRDDPLAGLELDEDDFEWIGTRLAELTRESAHPRLVCTLEGGYDIKALESSLERFLRAVAAA
ncbi:histone deacetylase family protein [Marinicauda sp. Alg238-R41]|uniref:histone deacetylase family protein n=1 Tax=Marinicauda sp. Alg238-R41 TaxID=2993447 RepID=UPI0022E1EA97|nr:histone deacetylase family protein [Marinicauda sp. Alg238-R41]